MLFSCQKHGGMQRKSPTQRLGGTGCTSGLAHQGVEMILGNTFHSQLRDISFREFAF